MGTRLALVGRLIRACTRRARALKRLADLIHPDHAPMQLSPNQVGVLVWVHGAFQLDGSFDLVLESAEVVEIHLNGILVADD